MPPINCHLVVEDMGYNRSPLQGEIYYLYRRILKWGWKIKEIETITLDDYYVFKIVCDNNAYEFTYHLYGIE